MKDIFKLALHPKPEKEGYDTGLRFTDVLFGFVIKELFTRLLNWAELDVAVRSHLIVGTTLVLGSWIGFRNSLYRSGYRLKFFNLPFFRFLVDQLMLILYFRVAVLTPVFEVNKPRAELDPRFLAASTTKLVMWVFVLYVVWDLLGIRLANATTKGADGQKAPLYPDLVTNKKQSANWEGFWISMACLALLAVLWWRVDCYNPPLVFLATIAVLLVYRFAKEMRTSWKLLHPA